MRKRSTALLTMLGVSPTAGVVGGAVEIENDWLLYGITIELKNRGQTHPPLNVIKGMVDYKTYKRKVQGAHEMLTPKLQGRPIGLSHAEKLALGIITTRALAVLVAEFAPITLSTLLRNADLYVEALEKSFPGYLESSTLLWLLRRGKRHERAAVSHSER